MYDRLNNIAFDQCFKHDKISASDVCQTAVIYISSDGEFDYLGISKLFVEFYLAFLNN